MNVLAQSFSQMASQLKASFTELEAQVAERTIELQQAKESADNANQGSFKHFELRHLILTWTWMLRIYRE